MYNWLRRKCDHRTIAEMSIWYTITAVATFMVIIFFWGLFTGIANGEDEYDAGGSYMVALLASLFLWLVFLAWLWIGLVRTAWKWSHERLSTRIFKYLQRGFIVGTVLTILFSGDLREDLSALLFLILAFDIAIVVMIFNFLSIAWFARCKMPLRAYWDICSIVAMVIIQIWLFT